MVSYVGAELVYVYFYKDIGAFSTSAGQPAKDAVPNVTSCDVCSTKPLNPKP